MSLLEIIPNLRITMLTREVLHSLIISVKYLLTIEVITFCNAWEQILTMPMLCNGTRIWINSWLILMVVLMNSKLELYTQLPLNTWVKSINKTLLGLLKKMISSLTLITNTLTGQDISHPELPSKVMWEIVEDISNILEIFSLLLSSVNLVNILQITTNSFWVILIALNR